MKQAWLYCVHRAVGADELCVHRIHSRGEYVFKEH